METNFHEKKQKHQWGTKMVIFLLAVSTLCLWLIVSYAVYCYLNHRDVEQSATMVTHDESIIELCEAPTIEEVVADWRCAVKEDSLYGLYLQLPEVIFTQIITRIGTNVSPTEIASEYIRNKSYYISLQISKQLKPNITGPDAENIEEIKVKTIIKEPKENRVTIIPSDTLM